MERTRQVVVGVVVVAALAATAYALWPSRHVGQIVIPPIGAKR